MTGVKEAVREFHEAFRLPIAEEPQGVGWLEAALRHRLQEEETNELKLATLREDVVEVADALADIVYVAYGTALVYGIDLDAVVAEVHRSNMTKLGENGEPLYRQDGKVMKGPNYEPPRIAEVLGSVPA